MTIDCEKPGDCAYPGCDCPEDDDPFDDDASQQQPKRATVKIGPVKPKEIEDVSGYLFTHADCPECGEVNEYEGDCASRVVACTACDYRFRIYEVK